MKISKTKKPIALITGATSGIGRATAKLFAANKIHLVICGRRKKRLDDLKKELSMHTKVFALSFDVQDKKAVFKAIESLPKSFSNINILINNAGNAHGLDPIEDGDLKDWEAMLDSNVKGLLYVSKAIMPKMITKKSGHIINIGSIAGKEVYPMGNVYCASKYAVDAISQGMRIDLNKYGIRVGAINPGLVATEFSKVRFKDNHVKAKDTYTGYMPLQPEDIADVIYFAVTRPPHVNIADLLILPTAQANATIVKKEL